MQKAIVVFMTTTKIKTCHFGYVASSNLNCVDKFHVNIFVERPFSQVVTSPKGCLRVKTYFRVQVRIRFKLGFAFRCDDWGWAWG